MKRNKRVFNNLIVVYLALICVTTLFFTSALADENPLKKSVITNISTMKLDDATEILIDSDSDFTFNLYKPDDPYKIITELKGVDLGDFTKHIKVEDGGIAEIVPTLVDPDKGLARIEIILSDPALDIRHLQRDNSLIILVSRP